MLLYSLPGETQVMSHLFIYLFIMHLFMYLFICAAEVWDETVVHSQGVVRATRDNLVDSEMERIQRYTEKGEIK